MTQGNKLKLEVEQAGIFKWDAKRKEQTPHEPHIFCDPSKGIHHHC